MKILIHPALILLCLTAPLWSAPPEAPFTVQGGLSPDKKLAVVVFGNINWDTPAADTATDEESHVYLYDEANKKIIGALEEVDVDGGNFGYTQENVKATWSPDGHFLVVGFRAGRMSRTFELYEIKAATDNSPHKPKWRANPQTLPNLTTGPGVAALFKNTQDGPHIGDELDQWVSPTVFSVIHYGLLPKDEAAPFSGAQVRIVYTYSAKKWTITKVEKVPDDYWDQPERKN